jgi:hypothetical protein
MRTRSQNDAPTPLRAHRRTWGAGYPLGPAWLLVPLVLWGFLGGGGTAPAEAQSIWVTPSFGVSEAYDTNVTLSPNATSDFVTSLKPGLALEFKDYPFTLNLSAGVIMQIYAENPSLDTYTDNVAFSGGLTYAPTPRLTLSLADTYTRNVNPALVTPEVGITTGRFASTSNTVAPSISYKLDQLTTATLAYSMNVLRSDSSFATDSTTQTFTAGVSRELTPVVSGGVQYVYSLFQVSEQPDSDTHSPQITLAVRYTPTITVTSNTGPIWIKQLDGSYKLSYSTSTQYAQVFSQGQGLITLGYSHITGTGGVTGIISTTQSVAGGASFQATQALKFVIAAAWSKTESVGSGATGSSLDVTNYTASATLTYRLLSWLDFDASYRYLQQSGTGASAGVADLRDHIFTLGLTATDRFRLY